MHRQLWAAATAAFVTTSFALDWQNEITLAGLGIRVQLMHAKFLKSIRFLDFISNKHKDFLAGSRPVGKAQLILSCTNAVAPARISGATKVTVTAASHIIYQMAVVSFGDEVGV